jgi:phage FluMu gp28-like protein
VHTAARVPSHAHLVSVLDEMFLPYQRRADHDEAVGLFLRVWSRQVGKTMCAAWQAVRRRFTGATHLDLTYSSHSEGSGRDFMETAARFARDVFGVLLDIEGIDSGEAFETKVMSIRCPVVKGRAPIIRAISSNPTQFRGRKGDIRQDEAAFQPQLQEAYDAAQPCLTIGGAHELLTSAGFVGTFAHSIYEMGMRRLDPSGPAGAPRPTDLPVRLQVVTIDDAIADGLVERLNLISGRRESREEFRERMRSQCRSQEIWDREFLCKWSSDADSYYPWTILQPVMRADDATPTESVTAFVESVRRIGEASGRLVAGVDVARKNDRFAIVVRAKIGTIWRTAGILSLKDQSFDAMEAAIAQTMAIETKARGRVSRICIDATGLGMQLAERTVAKYRHRAEAVPWTTAVREDCAGKARAMFERGEATLPGEPTLARQYHGVRREITSANNTRLVMTDGGDGHSDELAADWMAMHAIESAPVARQRVRPTGGCVA